MLIAYVLESGEIILTLLNCAFTSNSEWLNRETSVDSLITDIGAAVIGLAVAIFVIFAIGNDGGATDFRLLVSKDGAKNKELWLRLLVWLINYAGLMSFAVMAMWLWAGLGMTNLETWWLLFACYTIVPLPLSYCGAWLANRDKANYKFKRWNDAFWKSWAIVPISTAIFWIVAIPPIIYQIDYVLVSMAVSAACMLIVAVVCWAVYYKGRPEFNAYTSIEQVDDSGSTATVLTRQSGIRLRF